MLSRSSFNGGYFRILASSFVHKPFHKQTEVLYVQFLVCSVFVSEQLNRRLFSFNFTFQLSHYSILSFSPLLSSELDFVSRTSRKLFSFRSGYDGSLHSFTGISSTWGFLRSLSGVSLWERLGGGYLHWFWAFLYSRLVFSKTEVIYVSFSLYCKTRLFTFNFLNLQITLTLHGISWT